MFHNNSFNMFDSHQRKCFATCLIAAALCGALLYQNETFSLAKYIRIAIKNETYSFGKQTLQSYYSNTSQPRGPWADVLLCQEKRLERLKRHCSEYKLNTSHLERLSSGELKQLVTRFLVDDIHHVTLKSIPKTGCSSWKTMIVQNYNQNGTTSLGHRFNPHNWKKMTAEYGIKVMQTLSTEEILSHLHSYFSIITVRHPLARLESGFRDKILMKSSLRVNDTDAIASQFQMFLDDIVQTDAGLLNIHWRPATSHTDPCVIPFNFIAKTETAQMDMAYILHEKLSSKAQPVHEHKYTQTAAYARSERQQDGGKELPLFNLLTKPEETIKKLMAKYQRDMDLFGYGYKSEHGNIIALCDSYKEFNFCC